MSGRIGSLQRDGAFSGRESLRVVARNAEIRQALTQTELKLPIRRRTVRLLDRFVEGGLSLGVFAAQQLAVSESKVRLDRKSVV